MQTIKTKYFGPTDTRGSRIKATSSGGESHTKAYDHSKNSSGNHASAAIALARRLGWRGTLIEGAGFDDGERVFVLDSGDAHEI